MERRLTALGAPERHKGQQPALWLAEALQAIGAHRVRHPGTHRYAFRIGRTARERGRVTIALAVRPYPKRDADDR